METRRGRSQTSGATRKAPLRGPGCSWCPPWEASLALASSIISLCSQVGLSECLLCARHNDAQCVHTRLMCRWLRDRAAHQGRRTMRQWPVLWVLGALLPGHYGIAGSDRHTGQGLDHLFQRPQRQKARLHLPVTPTAIEQRRSGPCDGRFLRWRTSPEALSASEQCGQWWAGQEGLQTQPVPPDGHGKVTPHRTTFWGHAGTEGLGVGGAGASLACGRPWCRCQAPRDMRPPDTTQRVAVSGRARPETSRALGQKSWAQIPRSLPAASAQASALSKLSFLFWKNDGENDICM